MNMKVTAVESVVRVVERDAHRPAPDQWQRQVKTVAALQQVPPAGGLTSSIVDALGSLETAARHSLMAKERLPISPPRAIAAYKAMALKK